MRRIIILTLPLLLALGGCDHKTRDSLKAYSYSINEDYFEDDEDFGEEEEEMVEAYAERDRETARGLHNGTNVWYSTSRNAVAYHIYEDCPALEQTVHEIKTTYKLNAERMGRHLCGYCEERYQAEMEGEGYEFEW